VGALGRPGAAVAAGLALVLVVALVDVFLVAPGAAHAFALVN